MDGWRRYTLVSIPPSSPGRDRRTCGSPADAWTRTPPLVSAVTCSQVRTSTRTSLDAYPASGTFHVMLELDPLPTFVRSARSGGFDTARVDSDTAYSRACGGHTRRQEGSDRRQKVAVHARRC